MFDFITIGDAMQNVFLEMDPDVCALNPVEPEGEKICFPFNAKLPVRSVHTTTGGNAANTAVAFARLGFKTAFYTQIGNDEAGRQVKNELLRNRVDLEYLRVEVGQTDFSAILTLAGEHTILTYHLPRQYQLPRLVPTRWLYLTSMAAGAESLNEELFRYLKGNQVKLCFQPGTFQLKAGPKPYQKLLKETELLLLNKEEAEQYLGFEPTENFCELLDGLLELGAKAAVITDGDRGAYASNGKEYLHLEIIEEKKKIEATGAGDAFAAGFCAAIASGENLGEALRWGQVESSSVIQKVGAQAGLLNRRQLINLLADYPELQPISLC